MKRRALVGALVGCGALVGWACNLIIDHDVVQCTTDRQCEEAGALFERSLCKDSVCFGPKSCVGKPLSIPSENADQTVKTRVRFVNLVQAAIEGAEVLVCPLLDPDCKSPLGPPYTTSKDGYIYASVPSGFAGSFQVRKPPPGFSPDDFLPTILYTRRFLTEDEPEDREIELFLATRIATRSGINLLLGRVSENTVIDGKAIVFGAVFDCNNRPLAGATAKSDDIDAMTTTFYGKDGLPSRDQLSTTLPNAIFGYINVPVSPANGQFRFRVALADEPWADIQLNIEPNTVTTVGVRYGP